jgi:hypothetical protein
MYLIFSSWFNFHQYFSLSAVAAAAFLLYLRLAVSYWFSKRWMHFSILIVISAPSHSLIAHWSVLFLIYTLIFTTCFDGWCIQDKMGARNAPGQKFDKKSESAHQALHQSYLPTTVYDTTQHNLWLDLHFSDIIQPKINTWCVRAQVGLYLFCSSRKSNRRAEFRISEITDVAAEYKPKTCESVPKSDAKAVRRLLSSSFGVWPRQKAGNFSFGRDDIFHEFSR